MTLLVASALTITLIRTMPLSAQRESQDPHLRNDCRLAAQILETGQPAPHFKWAAETIPRCIETGGRVLATIWASPPLDSDALNSLYYASYTLRDARITDAAIAVALNRNSPQLVRLNAIRVLIGHAVPSFVVSIADLPPHSESDSVRTTLGGVSHIHAIDGDVPIGTETVSRIQDALSQLSADTDTRVARAAAYAHRQVSGRVRGAQTEHRIQ